MKGVSFDDNGVKKGAWSEEEDEKLRAYIQRYGHWNWGLLPKFAGLSRSGKSCRLRWMNYLRPNMKHGNFTIEEDNMIVYLRNELGNKWSAIAEKLPGRSDNEIKNRWNTHLRKRPVVDQEDETINSNNQANDTNIENWNLEFPQESEMFFGASSESTSYSSPSDDQLPSYWSSGSDCVAQTDTIIPPLPNYESTGDFWSEPFFNDMITSSVDHSNMLSPLNIGDDNCTAPSTYYDTMMNDDELSWPMMNSHIDYNYTEFSNSWDI